MATDPGQLGPRNPFKSPSNSALKILAPDNK